MLKKGKKQYPSLSITRNESKTKQYSAVEYLGYFLDDNIGTYHTLWVFCNSLIHGSHFDFACCAWYPHLLMSLKNKLQTAQNACIRFCLGMERRSYIGLSMSRIALINTLQWRLTVLKNNLSLVYMSNIYTLNSSLAVKTRRSVNSFVEPNYVREVSRKSIWCLGSKIWNGIEKNIKTCTSTNSFKHALKKQFLKN